MNLVLLKSLMTCILLDWVLMEIYIFIILFIYFGLLSRLAFSHCSEQRHLSSCGAQASHCSSFSCAARAPGRGLQQLQFLGSIVAAHGLSCSMGCGIILDQGSCLCLLHGQADSTTEPSAQPLMYIFEFFYLPCYFEDQGLTILLTEYL